ncbi:MAG: hypothetical protein AAFU71_06520 [Cyanobacteria bacterium J06632_22]
MEPNNAFQPSNPELDEPLEDIVENIPVGADRRLKERRDAERRAADRRTADRRQTPLSTRLKNGLWKVYAAKYQLGKNDLLPYSSRRTTWLVDDLAPEAKRYRFFDQHSDAEKRYDQVLAVAILEASHAIDQCNRRAIAVIEEIAETINKAYRLEAKDRREQERRASERRQCERRDDTRHNLDRRHRLN